MITRRKTKIKKLTLSKFDLGWLAGILEGEGYFGYRYNKHKDTAYLDCSITMSSTDEDIIDRLHNMFPGKSPYIKMPREGKLHHKPQYTWGVNKRQVVRSICTLILHVH